VDNPTCGNFSAQSTKLVVQAKSRNAAQLSTPLDRYRRHINSQNELKYSDIFLAASFDYKQNSKSERGNPPDFRRRGTPAGAFP
jgi:hypothetical protein